MPPAGGCSHLRHCRAGCCREGRRHPTESSSLHHEHRTARPSAGSHDPRRSIGCGGRSDSRWSRRSPPDQRDPLVRRVCAQVVGDLVVGVAAPCGREQEDPGCCRVLRAVAENAISRAGDRDPLSSAPLDDPGDHVAFDQRVVRPVEADPDSTGSLADNPFLRDEEMLLDPAGARVAVTLDPGLPARALLLVLLEVVASDPDTGVGAARSWIVPSDPGTARPSHPRSR